MTIRRTRTFIAAAGVTALIMTGCAQAGPEESAAKAEGYPVTATNCGSTYTFNSAPERGVLLKSASVPYLSAIGVLDRMVAKAGQYPREYYDATTLAALDKIPSLTEKTDSSGHLQISKETVLEQQPDLVLGHTETVNNKTLASAKVPLLEVPALCEGHSSKPTFEDIYAELTTYGKIFGKPAEAKKAATDLRTEIGTMTAGVPDRKGATAAVLFPTPGGGTTYAYGNRSMADPLLKAAGFTNVFTGVDERVFEISPEQLLAKNPDVIVLLHSDGKPETVRKSLTGLPGAARLKAVQNDRVLAQLFNYVEPPSPLALTGLKNIVNAFPDVK